MLQQRSGWPLKSASRLMAMVLELLARIASLLACLPSASNTLLGVEIFEYGFDDKVCVSHRRGELFGLSDALQRLVGRLSGQPSFLD